MRAKTILGLIVAMPLCYGAFWVWRQLNPPAGSPTAPDLVRIDSQTGYLGMDHSTLALTLIKAEAQKKPGQNLVFSPSGLFEVGTMLAMAAEGQTRDELGSLFDVEKGEDLVRYYQPRAAELAARDVLHGATSLWIDRGFALKTPFVDRVIKTFKSDDKDTLFPAPADIDINQWIAKATKGNIKAAGPLPPGRNVASFVSATYFKDNWAIKFERSRTKPRPFTLASGTDVMVPTMEGENVNYRYLETDDFFVMSLPFRNHLELLVVVPQKDIPTMLESEYLSDVLAGQRNLRSSKGRVAMPKWTLDREIELKPILTGLGIRQIFEPGGADLSNMAKEVWVGELRQKVGVELHEDGAEAYTFTQVLIQAKSSKPREKNFVVDQPFLFAIWDPGKAIFFAGIMHDPR